MHFPNIGFKATVPDFFRLTPEIGFESYAMLVERECMAEDTNNIVVPCISEFHRTDHTNGIDGVPAADKVDIHGRAVVVCFEFSPIVEELLPFFYCFLIVPRSRFVCFAIEEFESLPCHWFSGFFGREQSDYFEHAG